VCVCVCVCVFVCVFVSVSMYIKTIQLHYDWPVIFV